MYVHLIRALGHLVPLPKFEHLENDAAWISLAQLEPQWLRYLLFRAPFPGVICVLMSGRSECPKLLTHHLHC